MELEVSQKTSRICKALKLDPETMAFADLCATGWEPSDAYIVAFHKGSTWIRRAHKDEVQTENTTIHHFLPVQYPTGCHDCLYQRCDSCKYKREYKGDC